MDSRAAGLQVIAEMVSPSAAETMSASASSQEFGAFFDELAISCVYGTLWTRPGLDRRARSLITVAILITLRADEELMVHVPAAIQNGVTVAEMEELIYHSAAYAGFPAASSARTAALKALRQAKDLA